MIVTDENGYPIERSQDMSTKVAQYKDEVDALTLGQCVDHPKWDSSIWTVERLLEGSYRVWVHDKKDWLLGDEQTACEAAREALKTLLPERPQPVEVTDGDKGLAMFLSVMNGPNWIEHATKAIAEYRVKHSAKTP